ncbi:MAG: hypothetical protein GDA50_02765 [Alphaproteobacteria bacterium GM202ARS2]|nr:hypothetical protein [Alphaproteobacteria bacterium GM202ARS2]
MSNDEQSKIHVVGQEKPRESTQRKKAEFEEKKIDHESKREDRKDKIRIAIDQGMLALVHLIRIFLIVIVATAIPCHIVNIEKPSWLSWLLSFFNCGFVTTILTQTITGAIVTVLVAFYINWIFFSKKESSS